MCRVVSSRNFLYVRARRPRPCAKRKKAPQSTCATHKVPKPTEGPAPRLPRHGTPRHTTTCKRHRVPRLAGTPDHSIVPTSCHACPMTPVASLPLAASTPSISRRYVALRCTLHRTREDTRRTTEHGTEQQHETEQKEDDHSTSTGATATRKHQLAMGLRKQTVGARKQHQLAIGRPKEVQTAIDRACRQTAN